MNMKEKLKKLLASKKEQRDNLNKALIESDNKEERAAIGETLNKLAEEIRDVEEMLADVDKPAEGGEPAAASAEPATNSERGMNPVATMDMRAQGNDNKKAEARAKQLKERNGYAIDTAEARAVLVSSGTLATPTAVSGINDAIGAQVSSIVDMVNVVDAGGMGAYNVAYEIAGSEAEITAEGGDYHESEPTYGFVQITPDTATCISYISKQARKQTPLAYASKVNTSALNALRKKAAKVITEKTLASELCVVKKGLALDETFLRKVALSYGGDESIVGAAVLQINKTDLTTLGDVRGSDKKAVYEITPDGSNPNKGIIKDGGLSVPYVINSNLMGKQIYGQTKCFELALFSPYEINVSEDFAFNKGLLAVAGDVQLGGDVTVYGGFVVAQQAAE